jgi:hypothetical protein
VTTPDSLPDLSQPLNDFEVMLLAVRDGKNSLAELLDDLLDSEVVILLDKDPQPDDLLEGRTLPLLLSNPAGKPVLAMFSAAERSVPMALQFPQFGFGLPVPFRELLKVVRPGVGLVMNPGTAMGFEMPAENVARMQQESLLN